MTENKNYKVRIIAQYDCLLAFAMMVSYVETLLPFQLGIPGAKLGLANAAIVFALYLIEARGAICINFSRVILCGLLFGNMYSMLYSFAGAIFSLLIMIFLKKLPGFSMIGVSIAGGVMHNMGQLCIAVFITSVPVLLYYIPFLMIIGAVTGLLNGWLAKVLCDRVKKQIET